jgi:hypothetical protein
MPMNLRRTAELAGERIASKLVSKAKICGDDETDTVLLRKMSDEAEQYLSQFSWCSEVLETYFGGGVGGIFAVFFLRIRPKRREVDPWIWVMVGDIPSAYLPVSDCDSPVEAFETYVAGMSRWVELAREGKDGSEEEDVPPVDIPATPEWAERLNEKLQVLMLVIRPFFKEESPYLN